MRAKRKYQALTDFNSIKVRLERTEGTGRDRGEGNFNSIKVRLEHFEGLDFDETPEGISIP